MKTLIFIPTDYPSDLTDAEWSLIEPYFIVGNKSKHHKRSLMNAVRYKVKTGCQWRQLPHDFPAWENVWSFYRRTCQASLFEHITDELVKNNRLHSGKEASPTYGLIDSQSVKTSASNEERGYDGGKK
ncbi:MAG: transposase [Lactococcus garvieae]